MNETTDITADKNANGSKKQKAWWQHLLAIPIMVVIDFIALWAGIFIDSAVQTGEEGHPAPAATLFVIFLFCIITIVVVIRAVILCIRAIMRQNLAKKGMASEEIEKKVKPFWGPFIPLLIEIPVAIMAVRRVYAYEIGNFTPHPDHGGFPLPILSFILGVIFVILTIVLAVVGLIFAVMRATKQEGQ